MWVQRLSTALAVILGAGFGLLETPADAQEFEAYPLEARVWLDRGHEPVLQRGETARLYYRVSEDAFVAIFNIDTNGTIRLVFPNSPQENHFARGGRDYRVLFPGSSYWFVGDDPGMGYFFIVASPEPFTFADLRYSHYGGGWDLSFVGRQVYRDPYLAMDDYVAALIPDWEYIGYGLDFTSYNVDQRFEYPRFMCYECHGFRPYSTWNPYHYACSSFRVVIYNDPYYYPVTRYRGTRVVYVQPRRGVAHFSFKERAAGEPGTPQIVVRNTPPVSRSGVDGAAPRRAQPRGSVPSAGAPAAVPNRSVSGSSGSVTPGVDRGATRRPSSGTTTPLTRPTGRVGSGGVRTPVPLITPRPGSSRPVLERRPTSGSSAVPRTTPPSAGSITVRPSSRVKKSGGGTTSTVRPTVRSGGSRTTTSRPAVRSGGSSSSSRPTVRSGGSRTTTSRPTVRSSGSRTTTSRPAVRSSGSRTTTSRPAARSGGSTTRAPARTSRPPARRKSGGG